MNWFIVKIREQDTNELIFEMPIQAPMHNSVEGRFKKFIERNSEYNELLGHFEGYSLSSEHMLIDGRPV